jgi:hypothetical protein
LAPFEYQNQIQYCLMMKAERLSSNMQAVQLNASQSEQNTVARNPLRDPVELSFPLSFLRCLHLPIS